jgi:hypothetical protein
MLLIYRSHEGARYTRGTTDTEEIRNAGIIKKFSPVTQAGENTYPLEGQIRLVETSLSAQF